MPNWNVDAPIEIYEKVKKMADHDFRTMAKEIIYLVNYAITQIEMENGSYSVKENAPGYKTNQKHHTEKK